MATGLVTSRFQRKDAESEFHTVKFNITDSELMTLLCMNPSLYFKQLEIGPMQNYVYLIGSTETRKAAVVDAAWEIDTIVKIAAQDDMEITHAFVTHTHPDHVGGGFAGMEIDGVSELLEKCKAKVVVHKAEAEFLKGLVASDMVKTDNGDKIDVGGIEISSCTRPATRRAHSASWSMGEWFPATRCLSTPAAE